MNSPPYEVADRDSSYLETVKNAYRRHLPPRYGVDVWDLRFREQLSDALVPGASIIDIGAGARPTVAPPDRPAGCRYVGLDPSPEELGKAPEGSYDETVVAAAEDRIPELENGFDLLLSFYTMEHVESLEAALSNARAYLRPGGLLLMQMSGAFSPFSIANRILPGRLSTWLLHRANDRDPGTVFRAHYDRCWSSALERLLAEWREAEVLPLHTGAGYVLFSRPLTALYMGYEEWAYRREHTNLASYYLVTARP